MRTHRACTGHRRGRLLLELPVLHGQPCRVRLEPPDLQSGCIGSFLSLSSFLPSYSSPAPRRCSLVWSRLRPKRSPSTDTNTDTNSGSKGSKEHHHHHHHQRYRRHHQRHHHLYRWPRKEPPATFERGKEEVSGAPTSPRASPSYAHAPLNPCRPSPGPQRPSP